jgi:hypothetical protein
MTNLYKFTYTIMMTLAFIFIILAASPVRSAEIVMIDNDAIFIDGDILEGDGDKFIKLLDQNPDVKYVSMHSYGGLVFEGMQIAFAVNDRQLVTFIAPEGSCDSMCSVIFLSGYNKVMNVKQKLGFHPAYLQWEDGSMEIDPQSSAYISWWFGKIGIPEKIIWEMMETDPKTVITYTAVELINMGINIYLIE